MSGKKVAKNAFMLYIRMSIMLLVNLYMSRVVLNTLGVTDFGIYNVTGGVVLMFSFISNTMASASQRFFSYEIGKGNGEKLKHLFSATFIIYLAFAIIIFILAETIGYWFVSNHLNIPEERYDAAKFVYHASIFTFIFTIIRVPFISFIIAKERMSFFAWSSIVEALLKLCLAFTIVYISFDKLELYSLLMLSVAIIITFAYYIFCKFAFLETKLIFVKDKKLYSELTSYAGWNSFTSIANIMVDQGINITLNIFFGPVVNAARSISYQIKAQVTTFVGNVQMAANPHIIKLYAEGKYKEMEHIVLLSSRVTYYFMFAVALPFLLETKVILKWWLIDIPSHTVLFCQLVIINVLIETISGTVTSAIQATGKIRKYQTIVGCVLLTSVPLAYMLLRFGLSPEVTVILTCILSLICVVIRLLIYKELLKTNLSIYIKKVIFSCLSVSIIASVIPILVKQYWLESQGVISFLIVCMLCFICTITTISVIGITKEERAFLLNRFSKMFKRKVK
ncbi:lipopolysaccharide biosynthesis protein [Raoultella terrigena]|uniref:lipopolysaccharide biosynthesis protein n=1 Tax=Raoultella terrigena TaxID=577 RepID=UPI00384E462E